ncbi:MAG TPA: ROK family protein [Usitatibacter sp.]|jgi:glucokinase|nr:ROK family protein [Usitatibacter sp.]
MTRTNDERQAAILGLDIGGTKTLCALFDARFEVLREQKFRTVPEKGGLPAFERQLRTAVRDLLGEAARRGLAVHFVGVGCAGQVDMREGMLKRSPNLLFLEGYPFRAKLERMARARVFVANDVQCALYGEHRLGAARKGRHMIAVWIGTGVGGALIIDRKLYLGATNQAGDIGNYLLHAHEDPESPRKQVLDNVASRTAIAGEAATLAAKRWAPRLRESAGTDVSAIRSADIAKAIRDGDKALEKLVRSRAAVVGAAISNLVDFMNPDTVVLGGGLVEALPSLFRREVRKAVQAHASTQSARAARIVVSQLHSHAGTAGAARLALDMFTGAKPIDLRGM